jgi:hypothetical protein
MGKIITQDMNYIWSQMPLPRPLSIILAFGFWGFQFTGNVSHSEINLWLASCVSVFATIRYGVDFYKWIKNRNK